MSSETASYTLFVPFLAGALLCCKELQEQTLAKINTCRFVCRGVESILVDIGEQSLGIPDGGYRIYLIKRPGRLLNFWTLRVGVYSGWALIRGWALINFKLNVRNSRVRNDFKMYFLNYIPDTIETS